MPDNFTRQRETLGGERVKHHSWKTVHFSEQIMYADKYPSIFLYQIEDNYILYMYPSNMHP